MPNESHLSNEEINRYFKESIERHRRVRDVLREEEREVGIKSVEAIRKWAFEVLTISSAILGVFTAIGSNSPMVIHKGVLPWAFLCFTLTIIYGLYKLKKQMEEDLDEFPKIIDEFCESQTKIINAEEEFYLAKTQEAFNKMQQTTKIELKNMSSSRPKEGRNYDFDIIFYLFFLGLVFIGFSFRYRFGIIMLGALSTCFIRFCYEEINYYKKRKIWEKLR